jgi:uncharacterized protein YyaL (SSP411 family)
VIIMTERNRLAGETSPYLLQHAHNPVHWMPWGEEALAAARELDRPILLSVGYSACHWCHVMAHESFEDPSIAELMNTLYVNVKVDREERPDIDRIYQLAHQLMLRRPGGWPLTMFLTPEEQVPFFGGTYFPDRPRHGMPSFPEVLTRVAQHFREHREEIRAQRTPILDALRSVEPHGGGNVALGPEPLDEARRQLADLFDSRHGGFGSAPKFPHPSNLERLLRHHAASAATGSHDDDALEMVLATLDAMAEGGLYDQLGGGFSRYSVDEQWMIPHFEKMLYDNGPLLALYANAWQIVGRAPFERVARETAGWVIREMQSPRGGYYSTLDADSEGEEGRFYVWSPDEARALLEEDEYAVLAARFGLDRAPNFEGRHWHLHGFASTQEAAAKAGMAPDAAGGLLDRARAKLLAAREQRVRPGLDDKVLAAWNGLMIKGMSVAARALGEPALAASAERALDFVAAHMRSGDGHLLATWRDGRGRLNAYLDDHALLIDGILALLECRWRSGDLALAVALADTLLERFEDREHGGFFFTSHDHERLIHRSKPMADDALPAGNGVAARVLLRLGHLLGEPRYLASAERTLRAAWPMVSQFPHAHNALLDALEEYLHPPVTVVLRGRGDSLERWRERAVARYAPRRTTLAVPDDAPLPGLLAERVPRGEVVAYICQGQRCDAPIEDFETYDAALRACEVAPRRG